MYYTGVDPRTMEPVYTAVNPHEKAMQRALIQYRNPKNYELVSEALHKAGRTDLIGFDKKCLIRPRNINHATGYKGKSKSSPGYAAAQNHNKTDKSVRNNKKKTIRNVHKKKR